MLPKKARKPKFTKSYKLFSEALKFMPYGVNSNSRLWRTVCPSYAPCSIFIDRAKGSHIWDVDENEYIDYRLGYGPVILGHAFPVVLAEVQKAQKWGQVYALDNELEIKLARLLNQVVPCAEKVRFANSGTEATMTAIRIARAFTKKERIMKFEGHYHGSHDYVLFSTDTPFEKLHDEPMPIPASEGIPEDIKWLVMVERWNNFDSVEQEIRKHHDDLAAIILEPVMGNASVIPPAKDFLKHLRELCDRYDVTLIFDEVKTGFRLAMGGAQELFGVKPDLATYSKSLGNGFPVAALAGHNDIMGTVGPTKVSHGGTYTANPISLTAALTTIKELKKRNAFEKMHRTGQQLMKGMEKTFKENKIHTLVQGYPQMFQFMFTDKPVKEYRDLVHVNQELYARFQYELLRRGVMVDEDNEEPMFLSYSHSSKDIKHTLWALNDAVHNAKIPKSSIVPDVAAI